MENVHPDRTQLIYTSPYSGMNFHDWCSMQFAQGPQSQNLTADQALRADMNGYEQYLEEHHYLEQLQDFRNRSQQAVSAHFRSFTKACRRDGQTQGMDDPSFDEMEFYIWASRQDPDVPQWVQTSFVRSVERHAEEVRRYLYRQPPQGDMSPIFLLGGTFTIPQPEVIRSHLYYLLDESENFRWSFGNPVPALLQPIIPRLTHFIAIQAVCSEEGWTGWHSRASMAIELMNEAARSGLRHPLPNHPITFDDKPHDHLQLDRIDDIDENLDFHLMTPTQLNGVIDRLNERLLRLPAYHETETERVHDRLFQLIIEKWERQLLEEERINSMAVYDEEHHTAGSESSPIVIEDDSESDTDMLREDDFWRPPPSPPRTPPTPTPRQIQDAAWRLAALADLSPEQLAVALEFADQREQEDEDSHVTTLEGWFDPDGALGDRRPSILGPPPHPADIDHDNHRPYDPEFILYRSHRRRHSHQDQISDEDYDSEMSE
ncbi:uncharacterized protein PAC_08553 [Phialocephala subalpina]|uniref:Uncharacterized protein n=1 Tax=Phialocephala subalpina TaxID=576137 RepID=A0A1L7X0X2_9HELO|nr:uncharacterized protein PAC_08553 [Phialocephala subalpina]